MKIQSPISIVKTVIANKRYEKMIAESQAKIGPYVPVSYTQVWA